MPQISPMSWTMVFITMILMMKWIMSMNTTNQKNTKYKLQLNNTKKPMKW